jgi:precorrin-6A synthase
MKTILIVGVGAGNPEYITVQAVNALNRADVFFLMDKGSAKAKLNALRRDILQHYVRGNAYRIVEAPNPERPPDHGDYPGAVGKLNRAKGEILEQMIANELGEGQCGAFLVWGDPSLYDSTVRIIEAIAASGRHALNYAVIPGITSVQALTAQHRVPLNSIGGAVEITTGRQLAMGLPQSVDSVVVMLDAEDSYRRLVGQGWQIHWGAYLGTPDEILIAGPLDQVADQITQTRNTARQTHGWIMDTYLLKRIKP